MTPQAIAQFYQQVLRIGLLIALVATWSNSVAQQNSPVDLKELPLPVGRTSEYELESGEMKVFFIRLKRGEALRVEALERDINIRIVVVTRDKAELLAESNFGSRFERETASVIAKVSTEVLVAIGAPGEDKRGTFQLSATVKPMSDKGDEQRVTAEKLLSEAVQSVRENRQGKDGTSDPLLKAINKAEQATTIWRALDEPYWEAFGLMFMGEAQARIGKEEEASANLGRALATWRTVRARHNEALTLGYLAGLYIKQSKFEHALVLLKRAVSLSREINHRKGEENDLRLIRLVYFSLGDREKADVYDFALFLRPNRDDNGMAEGMHQYGLVHSSFGSFRTGIYSLELALEYAKLTKDKDREAAILFSLGEIYIELGKTEEAAQNIQASLEFYKQHGYKTAIASSLARLCDISLKQQNQAQALAYANQALAVIGEFDDQVTASESSKRDVGSILNSVARAYTASGQQRKALKYMQLALWSCKRHEVAGSLEAEILEGIMQVWRSLGNRRLATFYGKQAITVFENLRFISKTFDQSRNQITPDRNLHKLFLKNFERIYKQLAGLLIEDGRFAEAQEVLSALKDQQFFDPGPLPAEDSRITSIAELTRRKIVDLSKTPREADSANRYDQASKKIVEIPEVATLGVPPKKENLDKLATAIDEFAAEIKLIEADFARPALDRDKPPEPPGLRELQAVLRTLDTQTQNKTAAVYTIVGDESFYVLAITADNLIAASHPIKREQLNQLALRLWGLLQSDAYNPTRQSKQLYSVVFKPLETKLPKDVTTILWSLDDSLRYVPMAALFDGQRYLVERYNHVLFTRADREKLTRAVSSRWTGTGFGSSTAQTVQLLLNKFSFDSIPGVSEELDAIFKQDHTKPGVMEGEVLLDSKFNKANFLAALKQHRPIVHIASHFNLHPGDEGLSFLLFGDGTAMTLSEMKRQTTLFQSVELLTLSACNTAAQLPDATGREIDGFAELAQRLGANAILASLWPVTDNSTPQLMHDFYATREAGKLSKVEALRHAQLLLLHGADKAQQLFARQTPRVRATPIVIASNPNIPARRAGLIYIAEQDAPPYKPDPKRPFSHPYYWAPFVLFGNPR